MADTAFDPASLLNAPLDSFEKPPPMPVGSYVFTILKFEYGKTKPAEAGKEGTTFVTFQCRPDEALPDVDEDTLAAFIARGKPLNEYVQKKDFYITPDAMYRLKDFLRLHVGVEGENLTTAEMIQAGVGMQFVGQMTQTPNKKDPENPYVNLTNTAPVTND